VNKDPQCLKRVLIAAVCCIGAALAVAHKVNLTQAAPPKHRRKRHPAARVRARRKAPPKLARNRLRRRVVPARRRLILGRVGRKVVVREGTAVVRDAAAPIVITDAKGLQAVPKADHAESTACRVSSVRDDQTAVIHINGVKTPVRMIGVEQASWQGGKSGDAKARAFVRNLLAGEFVYVQYDEGLAEADADGNKVAYLYRAPDGLFLNLEVIRQGYAVAADGYDWRHQSVFRFYERKARADAKGLWPAMPAATQPAAKPAPEAAPKPVAPSAAGG